MDLKSFETLIKSENSARLFLAKLCWKKGRRICPRCRARKIYRIIGKRFRYNNRDKNIFNLMAQNLCNFVPDLL